ncbi:MAG: CoA transferase [Acidimicrobiales bacterium]
MTGPGSPPTARPAPAVAPGPAHERRALDALGLLPAGAVAVARTALDTGRGLLGVDSGRGRRRRTTVADEAAEHLVRPLLTEPGWPHPTPPLPVGTGAVHADLTDDDHDALARLREVLGAGPDPLDPETLAATAQEWRLAVTPYRPLPSGETGAPPTDIVAGGIVAPGPRPDATGGGADPARHRRHPAELTVVDLSALWAGPLATSLLAELGARVVKVDSDVRPDGLRHHPAFYRALNGAKEIIDLDLRVDTDRRHLDHLLAGADLVVDSFSRRVMPNLGYGPDRLRARFPQLASLSIVAFPAGTPEQDWVSYGPGVHALVGLADTGSHGDAVVGPAGSGHRRYRAAPIAYPDALAGLAAFATAADLVTRARPANHGEVSLASVLAPLVSAAVAARTAR